MSSQIIDMLQTAYRMELETVINYLSNSIWLDGMRAEEVKRSLAEDVPAELAHGQRLANRIKQLGGTIPGSLQLEFDQSSLQPPEKPTNLKAVIKGVIEAEESAIAHYRAITEKATSSNDFVTADLATELLADEEEHRTQFVGFLREFEAQGDPGLPR
jgi:bacterioferritin